jgi:predicted Zn-dependent protease
MRARTVFWLLALAGSLASGGAADAATFDFGRALDTGKGLAGAFKDVDEKDEIEIGRELAGRVLGVQPLVNDPELQAYVNRVGRWIASHSERPDLPWRFGVIDHPLVNAFAMPGGFILVTRGLYEILDNEAQLAGVLGHEIAHVVRRHHVTLMQQGKGIQVFAKLAQSQAGNKAPFVRELIGQGATIVTRGLDRGAETEADQMGVVLAARAGYSPYGLVEVLHKLAARKPDDPGLKILYSTHPSPRDRLTTLGEALEPRVEALPAGQEPPIRLVSGDVAPAPTPARGRAAKRKPGAVEPRPLVQSEQQAQPEQEAQPEQPAQQPGSAPSRRRGPFGIDIPGGLFGK